MGGAGNIKTRRDQGVYCPPQEHGCTKKEQPDIKILGIRAEHESSEMGEETGMDESEGDIDWDT